jgi:enoyl-CoA hydratase/carnithine racemase
MDLILTGRPVKGKEALEMGLVNMQVACGTSLGQAVQYANSIAKFPQECLNRDRISAYNAMYDANSFESALQFEMQKGLDVIMKVHES